MALTRECYCMCPPPAGLSPEARNAIAGRKAAVLKEADWGPNPTINIGFLEGDGKLRERVMAAARLWISEGGANVTLAFLTHASADPKTADVRVAFAAGRGSWSMLGTECRGVARDKPTMNFGWIDGDSSDDDVISVVLHEFGHALGLIHEHQNPRQGIAWDEDAVRADLRQPPNNWNDDTIKRNMFDKYDPAAVVATGTDPNSIMMYQIPARWTRDGFSTGFNKKLSAKDKQLIQSVYF